MLQGLNDFLKYPGKSVAKTAALITAYAAWTLFFRLICLSFLVYFVTRTGHAATFEEINETFTTNEIPFMGLSAGCFFLLLKGLSPLIEKTEGLSFTFAELKSSYFPGFLQGLLLACSIVAAFLAIGNFRFVGFFVQLEDTSLAVLAILFRIAALLAIGLCEEYLFRNLKLSSLSQILFFSAAYSLVKLTQFELSWTQLLTLFLLSTMFSVKRMSENSFLGGAGFWSGMLIVFHPFFSLPVLGSDFSGIFLLKYQGLSSIPAPISGGIGGPLSSLALQAVLLIEIVRGWLTYKKSLLNTPASL